MADYELVVQPLGTSVVTVGQQGPAGPPGSAGASYTHVQASASAAWTINHNLGFRPNVVVFSTGGLVLLADVVHASVNQAIVSFAVPLAGSARCS